MATPKKKKKVEICVSDIEKPVSCCTVLGMVNSLSHNKLGRRGSKYFTGNLSDDTKLIRFESFNLELREELKTSSKEKTTIALTNCKIDQDYHQQLVLYLTGQTRVETTTEKFNLPTDLPHSDTQSSHVEKVINLLNFSEFKEVTIEVRVVFLMEAEFENEQKILKQDCIVADATGMCHVILWEDNIGKMEQDKSYRLVNAIVKRDIRHGVNNLSIARSSLVEGIQEIVDVNKEFECRSLGDVKKIDGQIVGVLHFDLYMSCSKCLCKTNKLNVTAVECSVCRACFRSEDCFESARAELQIKEKGGTEHSVTAFGPQMLSVAETDTYNHLVKKLLCHGPVIFVVWENILVHATIYT